MYVFRGAGDRIYQMNWTTYFIKSWLCDIWTLPWYFQLLPNQPLSPKAGEMFLAWSNSKILLSWAKLNCAGLFSIFLRKPPSQSIFEMAKMIEVVKGDQKLERSSAPTQLCSNVCSQSEPHSFSTLQPYLHTTLGKPWKEKKEIYWSFTNIFPFFPWMIKYWKWSICLETYKKWITFFPQLPTSHHHPPSPTPTNLVGVFVII